MKNQDARRKQIVSLVNKDGFVSMQKLKEYLPDISEVTLRKDLRYLDATMQLIRVHGGTKSLPTAIGAIDNHYVRLTQNVEKKKIIAAKACTLLKKNNSIYIAAGTTCNELAKAIPNQAMQVFTDGVATALELSKCPELEISIFGGELDIDLLRISGSKVLQEMSTLRFDYAFFGADGYRPEYGFICCNAYYASLLQAVREHTEKLVVLMDSSKINASRSARFFPTAKVDIVISDDCFDPVTLNSFIKANVTIL